MTESPETPTPSLADRLDETALDFDAATESPNLSPTERADAGEVAADLRAAAAQLRQLDRIDAAAGDEVDWRVALDVCRELAVRCPSWASDLGIAEGLLRRLRDALEVPDA